jgi:hypothetical protein
VFLKRESLILSVFLAFTATLALGACDTGAPAATGASLTTSGNPAIFVNLCPGALVTEVNVTNADDGTTVWQIRAKNPSAKTTYSVGKSIPGFITSVGKGVRLRPDTNYGAFVLTASGRGGNQVAAFQGKQLKPNLVYTSEPQSIADWSNKPITATAFWAGPCRN